MATNTTNTFTNHTGNGSTTNFSISFTFLANNEIDVTVAGVLKTLDTHYTISGSTVTFTSGNTPADGAAVKFQRDTNISTKKVDFIDGSVLTETDLDTNSDQVLFAQQEIIDKLNGIEEGATGDQTNAEIRAAVEAASDSNVFTDADHSKLNAIEASATADQTAAEIRTLVESASDSNVFTDADHTKLNGIEASATADQTNAEIRAAVEAATDSNVFTDADHTKLNGIEASATADQTVSEIKSLIAGSPLDATHLAANSVDSSELVDGSVDHSHLSNDCVDGDNIADNSIGAEHLQANSVTTSEIADAELSTLAGMQSGTASKLADSTALTADIADLNQIDGMAKQTTITDDDTKFPTSGAVVDFVAAQLAPIGGLEVIATDAAFPNTQPASGVVISIADAGGLVVNSSGTSTTARTVGGSTVTINNFASNFNSSTVDAGVAIMVSSTGAGNIYNYHKATLKEADLLSLSGDINDFGERYRVTDGEPSSNNDEGDLIYDKQADKMKVFDSTTNSFKEVTSVGDFKFLFLCPAGGSGSPTINGSIATYDLREGSTSGSAASVTNAAQLLVSINGVLQKPNTGTSAPSEGFAMVDSNTIIFGSNLPTGAEVFVTQIGSAIALQVPADDTVSSAKIQNGSVIEAKLGVGAVTNTKIGADAVNGSKIADDAIGNEHIASNAVNADSIAADAVGSSEIAANAVGSSEIAANAVGASELADNAVDTAAVADNAITQAKLNFPVANRNLIINGAMQVAQRATSVNKTGANSTYTSLDRYRIQIQAGTITESQQDLSSSDTPYTLGFRKFLRVLNQSGIGAGAAQYLQIDQLIEAQDIAQSGWNFTSSSSFLTLSFWVRASVTQAYYGWIRTEDGTSRVFPYKICDSGGTTLTANTWTKIEVQIPGSSGITINNDNGAGLFINFVPYYGTNYTTSSGPTLNDWNTTGSGTNYFPDMTTTWATTTNATFDITGIQLEVGSVATDFEHRSFGQEFTLCQRYCQVYVNPRLRGVKGSNATDYQRLGMTLLNTLRASPSATWSGTQGIYDGGTSASLTGISVAYVDTQSFEMDGSGSGNMSGSFGAAIVSYKGSDLGTLTLSAEL